MIIHYLVRQNKKILEITMTTFNILENNVSKSVHSSKDYNTHIQYVAPHNE
jgi:hypothetical protein